MRLRQAVNCKTLPKSALMSSTHDAAPYQAISDVGIVQILVGTLLDTWNFSDGMRDEGSLVGWEEEYIWLDRGRLGDFPDLYSKVMELQSITCQYGG